MARQAKRKFPWKQNLRKVPDLVRRKLRTAPNNIVVAAAMKIPKSAIGNGVFQHLGITLKDDEPAYEADVLPSPGVGRWSATNVHGRQVVRRDLPKITKSWSVETPNWGDWSYGSHPVTFQMEVYPRENIPPKQLAIKVSLVGEEPAADPLYVFRFEVDEVLDKGASHFEGELFYNLNLLQENIGHADVFPSEATVADYLRTLYVSWEILPPGERETNIATILRGVRGLTEEQRSKIVERYDVLEKLKPRNFVAGTSGFRRYFGAQFEDDLVVFENVEYGNAIYVMGEDWERLSKLSRMELMAMTQREDFTRIPHTSGWKERLRAEIKRRRGKKQ